MRRQATPAGREHPSITSPTGGRLTRRRATAGLLALAASAAATGTFAQGAYPQRQPVRVVVPFAAGGTVDVVARAMAVGWGDVLKQQFIVDNRAGAGGTVGADNVAKAPADGYTLLAFHVGLTYGNGLFKRLPYDVQRDFQPIGMIGVAPSILVVTADFPARSVADLLALAKKDPGALNYASAGIGASSHLAVELLQVITGARMTHVPYRGGGPAITATIGGETQLMIETSASVLPQVKAGKLRALAVTGEQRLADLPDVPTMKEAGVADYVYTTWFGLWAPAGTPGPIVAELNRATAAAMALPAVKQSLARAGVETRSSSTEAFDKLVRDDLVKWTRIIQAAGITPE